MLNELIVVEAGARQAGVEIVQGHPDVKDARRMPTLVVRLDARGHVERVLPLPQEATAWTLRNGQKNSFPFIQPAYPFWLTVPDDRRQKAVDRRNPQRRQVMSDLAQTATLDTQAYAKWPGDGFRVRLEERRLQLDGRSTGLFSATIERFVVACEHGQGLLREIASSLVDGLLHSAQESWIDVASALFFGKLNGKTNLWECAGALLFEAAINDVPPIFHKTTRALVSEALRSSGSDAATRNGVCGVTGKAALLLSGNFPQPNLPVIGQTFLFSKNPDAGANDRYGRFAADAMPVAMETANCLAAAIEALTAEHLEGVTWCSLPGEAPKQNDLFLAFVEQAPNAPAAGILVAGEDDFSEEERRSPEAEIAESVAVFEKRTERLIEAVKANVKEDFRCTPVRLLVLRKVDPANRQAVYADTLTVGGLYDAATCWLAGEKNVPPWLVFHTDHSGSWLPTRPPHVCPLGLIAFSKKWFFRGGTDRQEITGITASEALRLFADLATDAKCQGRRRVERILRLVLARRTELCVGLAHVDRCRTKWKYRKGFDCYEVLRTVTVLGILLHKLGRTKERYMSETAFKLGQLLAAADVVHAGYCADVRGGDVPPSLLGNQVFTMAQSAPTKALAVLCRRWKPYDGWVKKAERDRARVDSLMKSDKQRGWDIRKAIRHAREMRALAEDLRQTLSACAVNDAFRAELLLGYMAGLPKAQKEDDMGENGHGTSSTIQQENKDGNSK